MITAFFTEIKHLPDDGAFERGLNKVPLSMREKILTYKSRQEQLLRLCGKLLLLKLLAVYQQELVLTLDHIKYDEWNKPGFDKEFEFNISHSGNMVICSGAMNARIGVDTEQHTNIDINTVREHFTDNEWNKIICSEDRTGAFYKMWVRKEALLKATGKGAFQSLHETDVSEDKVMRGNSNWYLHPIFVKNGYSACVATDKEDNIELTEIDMSTLIN